MKLSIEALGVTLGDRVAVRHASAEFTPGTLTGVIGPNGAGKSSLVRAILGLVPSTGRIAIDGADARGMPRPALARTLAYLPQGQGVHWPLSVERLVGLGRLPHLRPLSRIGEADRHAIERAMARADVLDLRDRIVTELSGGERARVLFARALAVEAPALIADEPLTSLDPGHQIDVMALLAQMAAAGDLVITVLHDLNLAARYCDKLILMDHGRIVAAGNPSAVLTPMHLRTVYRVEARVQMDGPFPVVTVLGR